MDDLVRYCPFCDTPLSLDVSNFGCGGDMCYVDSECSLCGFPLYLPGNDLESLKETIDNFLNYVNTLEGISEEEIFNESNT